MNMMSCSFAHASISAEVTCRCAARSVLLPTRTMTTSFPRCARTSAIHLAVEAKDSRLVMSNTTTATCESRIYDGMSERNRSCPAVSHTCTVSRCTTDVSEALSTSTFSCRVAKSAPIVARVLLTNWSFTNRSIMHVLPTPESPMRAILMRSSVSSMVTRPATDTDRRPVWFSRCTAFNVTAEITATSFSESSASSVCSSFSTSMRLLSTSSLSGWSFGTNAVIASSISACSPISSQPATAVAHLVCPAFEAARMMAELMGTIER
mmetsp:Transcript_38198/g.94984  ORF Transcript_38198/g.94984 Transcript_38198/m.94984 type:complete len:265 (-) Transcript_38198:3-797(-)